jgi:hypothetical protein
VRDDWLVGAVLDPRQAFLEVQFDAGRPGLVGEHVVQHCAWHADRGLAEALHHIAVDRAEPGAGLRVEIDRFADRAAAHQFGSDADLVEDMHAVGRDLQPAADPGRMRPRLEHLRVHAGALEQNGGDGAGDAGANDESLAGSSGHDLLLWSLWGRNSKTLNLLVSKIYSD